MCKYANNCLMLDDFVYFSTLIICITLGYYYKQIEDVDVKKHYGTGLGFIIAILICGRYLYHTIFMVWLNTVIIKCCDKRYIHKVTLTYTWLHLTYLHVSLIEDPYVVMLHQTLALRLVGMAFEMHEANEQLSKTAWRIYTCDINTVLRPTTNEIISYTFFFIGLHKGPYYTYEMFVHHFKTPFASIGDFQTVTRYKLKKLLVCMVGYLLLQFKYSPRMYYDSAFYEYDTDTRYLYNIPLLIMYFFNRAIITLLCTCVCTEAGFGIYPAKTLPIPGRGPTIRHDLLHMTEEDALEEDYSFNMLKCYNIQKLLVGPRMKDTVRGWEMSVQYWYTEYIYQSLLKHEKDFGSACSFLTWTLWKGASLQQMIISSTLWVYIHIEAEYGHIYHPSGLMQLPWDIGYSIMRMLCLIYLTPCFIITDAAVVLKYYNSIFWAFHGVLLVMLAGVVVAFKTRSVYS